MGAQYIVVMFGQTGHEVELIEKTIILNFNETQLH